MLGSRNHAETYLWCARLPDFHSLNWNLVLHVFMVVPKKTQLLVMCTSAVSGQ